MPFCNTDSSLNSSPVEDTSICECLVVNISDVLLVLDDGIEEYDEVREVLVVAKLSQEND